MANELPTPETKKRVVEAHVEDVQKRVGGMSTILQAMAKERTEESLALLVLVNELEECYMLLETAQENLAGREVVSC